jgi:hypothetical protein
MLDDGRYLYHQSFTPQGPPISLMTGLLTAMQSFVREVTGSYPTVLSAGGFAFHLEKIGPLTIVLTCSDERKPLQNLSRLGMRFINKFGEKVEDWRGNPSEFTNFKNDIEDILGPETVRKHVLPTNPLNSLVLLSLESEFQDVAKAIIQHGEATPIDLVEITSLSEYDIKLKLEQLVSLGHVGRIDKNEEFVYFIQ